jgi:hypothetical protein
LPIRNGELREERLYPPVGGRPVLLDLFECENQYGIDRASPPGGVPPLVGQAHQDTPLTRLMMQVVRFDPAKSLS